jgi:hypothetical protein
MFVSARVRTFSQGRRAAGHDETFFPMLNDGAFYGHATGSTYYLEGL